MKYPISSHLRQSADTIYAAITKEKAIKILEQASPEDLENAAKAILQRSKEAALKPTLNIILMAIGLLAPNALADVPDQVSRILRQERSPALQERLETLERKVTREVSDKGMLKLLKQEKYKEVKKEVLDNKDDQEKVVEILKGYGRYLDDAGYETKEIKKVLKELLTEVKVAITNLPPETYTFRTPS